MTRRRLIWLSKIFFVCLTSSINHQAQAIAPEWSSPIGTNLQLWLPANRDPQSMDRLLTLARQAKIRWNRDGFSWHEIERTRGVWDFSKKDIAVNAALEEGIETIGVLGFGHTAYGTASVFSPPQTPEQLQAFRRYVSMTVARYAGRVTYWEIWNEPNTNFFMKSDNKPAAYAKVLKAAYEAAKAANPDAKIIAGATAGVATEFIKQVLALGGGAYMDAVSIHPYTYPKPTEVFLPGMLPPLRAALSRHGVKVPLIVTEIGFPTHTGNGGVSESRQAHLLVRSYTALLAHGVSLITGYAFRNTQNSNPKLIPADAAQAERNFGILEHDFTPKASYSALARLAVLINNKTFERKIAIAGGSVLAKGVHAHLFSNADASDRSLVLWSSDEVYNQSNGQLIKRAVKWIDVPVNSNTRFTSITGAPIESKLVNGNHARLQISSEPIYIRGDINPSRITVLSSGYRAGE